MGRFLQCGKSQVDDFDGTLNDDFHETNKDSDGDPLKLVGMVPNVVESLNGLLNLRLHVDVDQHGAAKLGDEG
jgi:hypothetical protein